MFQALNPKPYVHNPSIPLYTRILPFLKDMGGGLGAQNVLLGTLPEASLGPRSSYSPIPCGVWNFKVEGEGFRIRGLGLGSLGDLGLRIWESRVWRPGFEI